MRQLIHSIFEPIFNFFYPSYCRQCFLLTPTDEALCSTCSQKIIAVASFILPVTQKITMKVFAAGAYQDPLRSMILSKLHHERVAFQQLGMLIFQRTPISHMKFDYIVPVPLHWTRYAVRGYNQAQLIAESLSKRLNVPVLSIVKRIKRTEFQSRLSIKQRQDNVKNVFVIRKQWFARSHHSLEGKSILLVDDLCTTGATLKNAARCLNSFRPAKITAVVGARAI